MITDRLYHSGAHKALELQSKVYSTYFYYFRVRTKTEIGRKFLEDAKSEQLNTFLGISHGDDVFLIFDNPTSRGPSHIPYSEDEKSVQHSLIKLYRSFSTNNFAFYDNIAIENIYSSLRASVRGLEIFSSQNFSMQIKDQSFGQTIFWESLKIED